jgi:thioredoxin-like negative regulator of GroEL
MKSSSDTGGTDRGPAGPGVADRGKAIDPPALLDRGRKAYAENRPRESVPPLSRLLMIDPGNVDALVILAGAFARTGAIGTANTLFGRVNKVDLRESRHWPAHVSVSIKARQLNTAHQLCRKIVIKTPTDVMGFQSLARIASLWGHNDETRRVLWRLHALLPNDPNIATGLARSTMMAGALEEAEILCRRAARLSKGDAERMFDLGRVLRARGKLEEADDFLDRAVASDASLEIARKVVRETAIDDDFRVTGEPASDS